MNNILLEAWSYKASQDSLSTIVADGCRDLIVKKNRDGSSHFFVSPLVLATYEISIKEGTSFQGLRLAPGVSINEQALEKLLYNPADKLSSGLVEDFCVLKPSVSEALAGLRSDLNSIELVSKNLGVSLRTLQRHIKLETGVAPSVWRSLARARRCARLLLKEPCLTSAALSSGYADQSHMSREMQRWFSCTPSALKSGCLKEEILSSGFD
ncbi:helix-turn-helix domain-containing protein [Agaribacterium sp. ZY112]|uniref:helix-turn-helix domain-containing protein n=1 Tax=Agaribacterium sp. ZY112 TaxID=3233574 RepID=UPI003525297D